MRLGAHRQLNKDFNVVHVLFFFPPSSWLLLSTWWTHRGSHRGVVDPSICGLLWLCNQEAHHTQVGENLASTTIILSHFMNSCSGWRTLYTLVWQRLNETTNCCQILNSLCLCHAENATQSWLCVTARPSARGGGAGVKTATPAADVTVAGQLD